MIIILPFDMCRWQVKDEDVEVIHRAMAKHHPLTFTGGGDPIVADHWFQQVEKILEVMEITSNATKIKLAAFQLEGESQVW